MRARVLCAAVAVFATVISCSEKPDKPPVSAAASAGLARIQTARAELLKVWDGLDTLRDEADALMLRKAQAYALLKSRGYKLPTLDELRAQQYMS